MKFMSCVAIAALACAGGAASASTVTLAGGGAPLTVEAGAPAGQNFVPQLIAAGGTTLFSGSSAPLTLTLSGDAVVTFSLVASESGFNNQLSLGGSPIISESLRFAALDDFTTGALAGTSFSTVLSGGTDLAGLLTYSVGSTTFGSSDDEFGVFADASMTNALTSFYLGLDDSGNASDDDHDDMIVRVDVEGVSAVPLPAAAWMLIAGLGGLFGLRKFRKTA